MTRRYAYKNMAFGEWGDGWWGAPKTPSSADSPRPGLPGDPPANRPKRFPGELLQVMAVACSDSRHPAVYVRRDDRSLAPPCNTPRPVSDCAVLHDTGSG